MNEKSDKLKNDDFAIIDKVNQRYFAEIEHSIPHFQQTLFDFQNECYKSWKNTVNTNIELQKEILGKSGINLVLPKVTQKIIHDTGEEIIKYRMACTKIAIDTIESGTKNVKTWNENTKNFLELNRSITHYWISSFLPKSYDKK